MRLHWTIRCVGWLPALGFYASHAIAQNDVLQAAGYNPSWTLVIAGTSLTFSSGLHLQEAPPKVTGLAPAPVLKGTTRTFDVSTPAGPLSARFVRQNCTDTISALVHPDTVTVQYSGTTYQGCGGEPLSLLQGREWVVEDIAARGVIDNTRLTLAFGPDGSLSGRASCNPFEGRYAFANGALTLGAAPLPPAVKPQPTRICPPALRRQDAAFFDVLPAITRWDFTADGALALGTPDGRRIVARRE